ncbi:hypothetical protein K443DRAFT_318619 [Laccaria amethystina LaAM-08-1]|uniref:Uncharacterized protein n=1 Tax=Laccaria amethystina LaAM-08-1 TaxID=1095629 RepID=A0A0C9YCU8_9AGAR|nr:hypothetical protein K443DRAFT_318619 [Laccaria amethystina LaAM-08-1]
MIYSPSLLLALVQVVVLVPIRGKSRIHGWKDKKLSNRLTKLPARAYARTYRLCLALSICTYGISFLLCHLSHQQARVRHSFLRSLGRHSLPQARALRLLKLQFIQRDCTSLDTGMHLCLYLPFQRIFRFRNPLFGAIPIPLGVVGPGQQHPPPSPLSCCITDNNFS